MTEEPTTLRINLSSEIRLKLCSIDLSELVNMDMLEKTVCLLAKNDISALHKLASEMKKYNEHAKPISAFDKKAGE